MKLETDSNRLWLVAQNKREQEQLARLTEVWDGWIAYSSDGYSSFGAIAVDVIIPKDELSKRAGERQDE